jgi:adenylyltransferase/sulfurtransferase
MRKSPEQRVLVIGVGGLGCPASLALSMAGVRTLALVDPDRVEESNLHRQLWYRRSDLGKLKVETAAIRLRRAFPRSQIEPIAVRVDERNVDALLRAHSVAIDGTDGMETKFMLSDAAVRCAVPLVYGGVLGMQGQAMLIAPGGPCLRCLFEAPPTPDDAPRCSEAGVLGSVAGVVGAVQAAFAYQVLRRRADPGKLVSIDGRSLRQRAIAVRRAADCPACGRWRTIGAKWTEGARS